MSFLFRKKLRLGKRQSLHPVQAQIIGGLIGMGFLMLVIVIGIVALVLRATNPVLFFEIEHYLTTPISNIS